MVKCQFQRSTLSYLHKPSPHPDYPKSRICSAGIVSRVHGQRDRPRPRRNGDLEHPASSIRSIFQFINRVFSWTPLSNQTGNYTISFTATDNGSPPMTDTHSVTVIVTGLPAQAACVSCQVSNFVLANLWWAVGGTLAGFILAWSASRLRLRFRAAIFR